MNENPYKMQLFPNYFKKIALVLVLISIVIAFLLKTYVQVETATGEILGNGFLIAMMFFIYSQSKEEDEMTRNIRLRSLGMSIFAVIIYCIIDPYINWFLGDGFHLKPGGYYVFWLLFMHYIIIILMFKGLEEQE